MNGFERITAMLDGKPVDHLPNMPITMMFAADHAGVKYGEYATDFQKLVDAQIKTAESYGFDYVSCISDPSREAADCGATIQYFDDQPPAINETRALLADKAKDLKAAGLRRVTISVDSLDEAVFREMSGGRGDIQSVLDGISAAQSAGLCPIKLNVVVQKGKNDDTVLGLLDHFRGSGLILRFIEYMDVGTLNGWRLDEVVSSKELVDKISARWKLVPLERNYRGEVAQRYAFEDGKGEIGFISSVSEPFCGACQAMHEADNAKCGGGVWCCRSSGSSVENVC